MTTTAGHTWTDTPAGRACATCPMTRRQLHAATEEAVGQQGWAHVGALNATEYREICEDREAALGEREAIWAAVVSVGSGR
jgi:hypothetical protein